MIPRFSLRNICLVGIITCSGALAFAYWYLERHLGLTPCPLCIFDRAVIAVLAGCFFIALMHQPARMGQRIYAGIILAFSMLGIALAGRHIHLQNLPPEATPDCLPDLGYMLEKFSPVEVIQTVFNSTRECTEIDWTFLGLTIPQQTLLVFILLMIFGVALGLARGKTSAASH